MEGEDALGLAVTDTLAEFKRDAGSEFVGPDSVFGGADADADFVGEVGAAGGDHFFVPGAAVGNDAKARAVVERDDDELKTVELELEGKAVSEVVKALGAAGEFFEFTGLDFGQDLPDGLVDFEGGVEVESFFEFHEP